MLENLVVILVVSVPTVLLLLLRTNAAIVFLSLCAGYLLVQFAGDEASLIGSAIGNHSQSVVAYTQLALMLIAPVLSAILLKGTMKGSKFLRNLGPAIAVGLVMAILAIPLSPHELQDAVLAAPSWLIIEDSEALIVTAGSLISLIVVWMSMRKPKELKKKKKHH